MKNKMFALTIKDEELAKNPKVEKYLKTVEEILNKTKVKAEYLQEGSSEIIEDTFEGHYKRSLFHSLYYGASSFRFLLDDS